MPPKTSGRRSGRTSRTPGQPRSSGRRSRGRPSSTTSATSTTAKKRVRKWTQVKRTLGHGGLIIPQWVPVERLTADEQVDYLKEQEKLAAKAASEATTAPAPAAPGTDTTAPSTTTATTSMDQPALKRPRLDDDGGFSLNQPTHAP